MSPLDFGTMGSQMEVETVKLGFIGCGKMANAIMGGIIKNGILKPEDIIGAEPFEAGRIKTKEANGIEVTDSNVEVFEKADVIFFTIKPQFYADMIAGIKDHVREDQLIISIAAGRTLGFMKEQFGDKKVKIVRTMPNPPAMVGEGMTAACPNENVTKEELDLACRIISGFGEVEVVDEDMLDVVTGVSGSGPAYVFMFIEALADGAVAGGMPRKQAYKFAAQTVLGGAKMVLDTGMHPGELKDMVTTPAGTTITAVRTLEKNAFRSTVIECVESCTEKARSMK